MDFITDAVLRYLLLPKTQYALQINGAWGTGKTHFVKNKLVEEIEKVNINAETEEKYKCYYISLNGVSKVDEIGEAVFFELVEGKKKLVAQGVKYIARYSGIFSFLGDFEQVSDNAKEDILKKLSEQNSLNIVLIFDDLERIADSLALKQVFGYINSNYIEHSYMKVIFISNDEMIPESSDYMNIKEKIIGRTLNFTNRDTAVLNNMAKEIYSDESELISYFDEEKSNIIRVMNLVFDDLNLRTIRFIFDSFSIIQSELSKICGDDKDIVKTLFLNVLIIGKEYKDGEIDSIKKVSFLHGRHFFFTYYKNADNRESNYENQFFEKYHQKDEYIEQYVHYFESVNEYIINGYLDYEKFKKDILTFLEFKEKSRNNNSENQETSIYKINHFTRYDDITIEQAQTDVLNKVNDEVYSAIELPELLTIFYRLKDSDMLFGENTRAEEVIKSKFDEMLEKWEPEEKYYFGRFDLGRYDPRVSHMIKKLKKKSEEKNNMVRKENIFKWFESLFLKQGIESELYTAIEYEVKFFEILLEIKIPEKYFGESNEFIMDFYGFLNEKYLKISNAYERHSDEVPYIEEFLKQVNDYLEKTNTNIDRIKKYNIELLIERLEKIKKYLTK
ncbi:P-loop NTPase fold protein [Lysinibacillus xylanilyticus]|uniref:P-loop NTPase fold protein n=1 Tax=Lysinibacillus xylanilyticus TaxID=582475 RepID=UPI00381FEF71